MKSPETTIDGTESETIRSIPSSIHKKDPQGAVLVVPDIIQSEWICRELESFKCKIGGIPRPDLQRQENGNHLRGPLPDPRRFTMEQSQVLQRQVMTQLGKLTQLSELTLGQDVKDEEDDDEESTL